MDKPFEKHWYVFYTCPRAEKKANDHLLLLGYETFLPLKKEFKIWRNRQRKLIETPLFASYLFVHALCGDVFDINKVSGICRCVTCAGSPVGVSDNDIMSLKIMQNMDVEVNPKVDFIIGSRIRIIRGPLCGYEGILIKINGENKFGVNIECANLIAMVDIESLNVEVIL